MPENFVYGADFTDDRRSPTKSGMTRKAFLSDKQALVSFLNAVFHLEGDNRIATVSVKNTELNILFPATKMFRLDIRATTSNGLSVNIEMQKASFATSNR